MKRLLLGLVLVFQCACVPIGFVTPPVEVQFGAAASIQEETEFAVPIRIDAQPMQLFPSYKERTFDFGIGYLFLPGTGQYLHGPGLNVGLLGGNEKIPANEESGLALRWGTAARANLIYAGGGFENDGWGLGLQGRIEWVRYSAGPFAGCQDGVEESHPRPQRQPSQDPYREDEYWEDDSDEPALTCLVGYAEGETSFGFFVEASQARVGAEDFYWFGAGLTFRLPASAAVGFATIF